MVAHSVCVHHNRQVMIRHDIKLSESPIKYLTVLSSKAKTNVFILKSLLLELLPRFKIVIYFQ